MKDNNIEFKTLLSKTDLGTLTFPEEAKLQVLSEINNGITETKREKLMGKWVFVIAPIAIAALLFLVLTQVP
ncbi:MAG: hypothetical protein ACO1OT_15130, partial [Heyndrickxia sp.]